MQISLSGLAEKLEKSRFTKKFSFVFENGDTGKLEGKTVSPVYLEETLSKNYFQKKGEKNKSLIIAQKKVDYGEFIDSRGVTAYLNRLYEDVDIYANNLSLMTNQFLSPLADVGPTFYMYYIKYSRCACAGYRTNSSACIFLRATRTIYCCVARCL